MNFVDCLAARGRGTYCGILPAFHGGECIERTGTMTIYLLVPTRSLP
jgi:hypothetical protein